MINNIQIGETRKLNSKRAVVFSPSLGSSYSHHAHITFFRDRFYATWSNGKANEDDLGQRIMVAESPDGEHWCHIRPVVTPEALGNAQKVLTAAGFHVWKQTLYLHFGSYAYGLGHCQNGMTRPKEDGHHKNVELGYVSTVDGTIWTAPRSVGLAIVPNHGPQKTASGRWIISGNTMFPYTDAPNGVADYKTTGIYGDVFGKEKPVDDSETIHTVTKKKGWKANLICEGSFFERAPGMLRMMLRSNSGRLWCAESGDDGTTWSEPYPTEFSNDDSKFHFGRLPDGRYYGVCNGKVWGCRDPLDMYISEDGENFSKHLIIRDEPYEEQFPGMYKGGLYGYPHTLIHEGYMYVIYSKRKETIEVTKFSIDQL